MRFVVVGGVAGGMSAAARLRRLNEDAEIIVLERGAEVSFANCGLPYYVSGEITDDAQLRVQTPQSLRQSLNLDVRINTEAVALDAANRKLTVRDSQGETELEYDELVLSPGAQANRPPIPGIDSPRVSTLRTVPDAIWLAEQASNAKQAVVLGAGFIGLEAAEAFNLRGVKTAVVELAPHVLPPLENEMAYLVHEELDRLGIAAHIGVAATEIRHGDDFDTVVLSDGTQIEADVIVLSVGVRPDTQIWRDAGVEVTDRGAILVDETGRTNLDHVWAVGDATVSADHVTGARRMVALAGPANRAGRLVADQLSGKTAHQIPATIGTSIVRVGKLTAAVTGANRQSLDQAGIEYHTIHLHPADHAGYFPGATQIHLVMHFSLDGKVLGAQAVGENGVDKRIDVIATAIRAGFTVHDLIDLDLAYSPPYGSAKDPVNMAGMVASNVLDATMPVWHAADLAEVIENRLILDVRSAAEFDTGHLPNALNIPHTQIRERIDEVKQAAGGRPIAVHCASGLRSYLALRPLAAAGFEVANLSGGLMTLRAELGAAADDYINN